MTDITKEEFLTWKKDRVTREVYAAFREKVEAGKEELSYRAGDNAQEDNRRVGKIDGLRTLLDLTYFDINPLEPVND